MTKTYEPDRQFIERLEWQLASELRRKTGRRRTHSRIAVPRPVAVAVVLTGIVLAGVAGIKAAELIQDSWRKKIEVARAETEVRLGEARLQSQQSRTALAEERFKLGVIPEEEVLLAKTLYDRTALDLKRARLNLEEVRRSGIAPRDELYAPLVGGRDFVAERLELDRQQVALMLQVLAARAKQLEKRQRAGLIAPDEVRGTEKAVEDRKIRVREIEDRLGLRKRFLAGGLSAVEVEIAGRLAAAKAGLSAAQSKVEDLKERAARAGSLRDAGMISSSEADDLREALEAAEAEMKLAALEVDVLDKVK